jgi:hypothetical protein
MNTLLKTVIERDLLDRPEFPKDFRYVVLYRAPDGATEGVSNASRQLKRQMLQHALAQEGKVLKA